MSVDLSMFDDMIVVQEKEQKKYEKGKAFHPHFVYALFSLNKDMFGWVHYKWFQCNHPLDPVEYDSDIVKGFKVMGEGEEEAYECDKDLAEAQKNYDLYGEGWTGWGVDWKFMDKVIRVPVGIELFYRWEV